MPTVGVVTVTYNSGIHFTEYMDSLQKQSMPVDMCILVDSGSTDPSFLELTGNYTVPVKILREKNVGVCAGNNIGWRIVRQFDYTLFLNPDAFLFPDFIERAVEYMEAHPEAGIVTPTLLGYDIATHAATGLVDTTGVVRSALGVISERDSRRPVSVLKKYKGPNEVTWVCSAVAMARRAVLNAIVQDDMIFNESFFMYKDDTDVSWRARRAGWKNIHHPELMGYHCRGWKGRKHMSYQAKLLSARNEVKLYIENRSPFLVLACFKYLLVRFFKDLIEPSVSSE